MMIDLKSFSIFFLQVFFAHNGWSFEILEQQEVVLTLPEVLRSKVTEMKTEVKVISRESTPAPHDNEEDLGIIKVGMHFDN